MYYLDTSVVVPMFVAEPASEAILAWMESSEAPLVSSDWLRVEFASALSIKVRAGAIRARQAREAFDGFEALCEGGLQLLPVSRPAFAVAARLASRPELGLRAADSLHLAMALEVQAEAIVTADRALAKSAERSAIPVHRF